MQRFVLVTSDQNCLQWRRLNLVDPTESPKIRLLKTGTLGTFCRFFSQEKKAKTLSSLNFLESGPRKVTKSDFFGIGPDPASSEQTPNDLV